MKLTTKRGLLLCAYVFILAFFIAIAAANSADAHPSSGEHCHIAADGKLHCHSHDGR